MSYHETGSRQIELYNTLPEHLQEIIEEDLDNYIYRSRHKHISDENIKLLHAVISPFIKNEDNYENNNASRCLMKKGRCFFTECSWCGKWKRLYNGCDCSKTGDDSYTPTNYFIMNHIEEEGKQTRAVPFAYICEPGTCDNHPHVLRQHPPFDRNSLTCDGCNKCVEENMYWHCDTCHDGVLGPLAGTFYGFDLCQHCKDNTDTWVCDNSSTSSHNSIWSSQDSDDDY